MNCKGCSHKAVSLANNFSRERMLNQGTEPTLSAYQSSAWLLDQTSLSLHNSHRWPFFLASTDLWLRSLHPPPIKYTACAVCMFQLKQYLRLMANAVEGIPIISIKYHTARIVFSRCNVITNRSTITQSLVWKSSNFQCLTKCHCFKLKHVLTHELLYSN